MNKFMLSFIIVSSLSFASSQYLNYDRAYIPTNDCSLENCYNGNCVSSQICICKSEYAEFHELPTNDGYYCTYRRHSKLKIFLTEFFLSFGIGHMVAGNVGYGIFKFILPIIACFTLSAGLFGMRNCNQAQIMTVCGIGVVCLILFLIMHIFDICQILFGNYFDGNGVALKPFN